MLFRVPTFLQLQNEKYQKHKETVKDIQKCVKYFSLRTFIPILETECRYSLFPEKKFEQWWNPPLRNIAITQGNPGLP